MLPIGLQKIGRMGRVKVAWASSPGVVVLAEAERTRIVRMRVASKPWADANTVSSVLLLY